MLVSHRKVARMMKPPFHVRGPCMAKLWLIFALGIIGVQMVFVVNLLVKKSSAVEESEVAAEVQSDAVQPEKPRWGKSASDDDKDQDRENAIETEHHDHDQPPIASPEKHADVKVVEVAAGSASEPTTVSPLEENNPMFNFLRGAVEQVFNGPAGAFGSGQTGSGAPSNPLAQLNSLMPMMALLPALSGGGQGANGLASVNWEKFMPMLERVERFAKYCVATFQQTVEETKRKHPQKAKEPSFISAVAMKGFFRIFANEDYQEEFLEIADDSFTLLEGLGMTDHVIDLVSGRIYEKVLNSPGGGPADGNFLSGGAAGLAAIFLRSDKDKKAVTTTTTTTPDPNRDANEEEEEEDVEEDEEDKAALVSNEHFESIMEVYDYMFREEENNNASAAKLEMAGRMFLQTWYGAMRRFAIEKGKLHPKPLTDASFEKYLESVEVPFSNILDYAYPIKNEELCKQNTPDLLIMITSKTQHTALRNAIRQTWGAAAPQASTTSYKVVFVLTDRDEDRQLVEQEAAKHGDVVSVDVPQTYEYVTRKALVTLDWPVTYCSGATYIFRTTDHMYVNISLLQKEITLQKSAQLMGNLVDNDLVQRVPLKLDHLFYDEYPFDKFRSYLKGYGFLMGMSFAKSAVGIAKDFPLLRTDDFAITGMLSAKLKVTPVGFKKHSVASLDDAPWEDTQKMTKLICENKDSVEFGSKLTAPKTLFVHATLTSCSNN